MPKTLTAVVAALSLALVTACSGTPQERQDGADQIFGKAKLALVLASAAVPLYNLLPPCSEQKHPPFCYDPRIAADINLGLAAAAETIESAEKVFAAANSNPEGRLDAAKAAQAALQELTAKLIKYGVTRLAAG